MDIEGVDAAAKSTDSPLSRLHQDTTSLWSPTNGQSGQDLRHLSGGPDLRHLSSNGGHDIRHLETG